MDLFRRAAAQSRSLGQLMVEAKLISLEQLQHAMMLAQKNGYEIENALVEQGFLTSRQLAILIGLQLSIPVFLHLKKQVIDPKVMELMPELVARKYSVMPLCIIDRALVVAMADPGNAQTIANLAFFTGMRIEPVVGILQDINEAIDQHYQANRLYCAS